MPLESGRAATPIPKWCGNPRGIAEGSVLAGVAVASMIANMTGSAQILRITVNVSASDSVLRDELEPVPERVVHVKAAVSVELDVPLHLDPVIGETPLELVEVGHQERRMGFPCRTEVCLHAEVQLDALAPEPASSARRELRRLLHPLQPE